MLEPLSSLPAVDLVEGDPQSLLRTAKQLVATGAKLGDLFAQTKDHAVDVTADNLWDSPAAATFFGAAIDQAAGYQAARDCALMAAQALAVYAHELQQAQDVQRTAQAANDQVNQAIAAHNTILAAHEVANPIGGANMFNDPELYAQRGRIGVAADAAQLLGHDARELAARAAVKAAAALGEAGSGTFSKQMAASSGPPSFGEAGHFGLDLFGLVPVVGIVGDGINTIWYSAEGDALNASLAGAAMVPGFGGGATAVKLGKRGKALAGGVTAGVKSASSIPPQLLSGWIWHRMVQKRLTGGGIPVRFVDEATGRTIGGPDWAKELYVKKPGGVGYHRLDGYRTAPGGGVLSLKSGQYGGADAASTYRLRAAIDELKAKYDIDTPIADVPSTPAAVRGDVLRGEMMLGIPVQVEALPQSVLDRAKEAGVRIVEIDIAVPATRGK